MPEKMDHSPESGEKLRFSPTDVKLSFANAEEARSFNDRFCSIFEGQGYDLFQVTSVDGADVNLRLAQFSEGYGALKELL
ncbi:MAG: hypothetical protein ACD_83C00059G0004 [uncultured bacterium]|uniref:Uncharacterized protein n=1 Tax=Berkelbacteria bacterium GW2011_GWA2_38_9 TaxID=1618334 RepID=A0A0G0PKX5_9BACT|nr:MAG: hypothetical protein ACD_83C00059G0004 [uncultured bacterium]KKQ89956.1 MAG: hypothetical protein UT11_C0016G0006 [Berkelbacteria bacterium GW2011_GWA2_38_9]